MSSAPSEPLSRNSANRQLEPYSRASLEASEYEHCPTLTNAVIAEAGAGTQFFYLLLCEIGSAQLW